MTLINSAVLLATLSLLYLATTNSRAVHNRFATIVCNTSVDPDDRSNVQDLAKPCS